MARAMKAAKKQRRDKANKEPPANFPALQLLFDPQTFGEKLFDVLNKNGAFLCTLMTQTIGKPTHR
jgi:hypothetical protein